MLNRLAICVWAAALALGPAGARGQSAPAAGAELAAPKLWAQRAARADGAHQLAERVKALSPGAGAKVGDLLARSPRLGVGLELALLAAADESGVSHVAGGGCEVGLLLTRAQVVDVLTMICRREKIQADFAALKLPDGAAALRAMGRAGAPVGLAVDNDIPARSGEDYFTRADPAVRKLWADHVTPAGRRQAIAAARADAKARLAKRVAALPFRGELTLAGFVTALGGTEADVAGFLLPARETHLAFDADGPVVTVKMVATLRTTYASAKAWLHRRPKPTAADIRHFERLIVDAGGAALRQVGIGLAPDAELTDPTPAMRTAARLASKTPAWFGQSVRGRGTAAIAGTAPFGFQQKRAAAEAAQLEARLHLAATAAGLKVAPQVTLAEWVSRDGAARLAWLVILQAARPSGKVEFTAKGDAEADVECSLDALWRVLYHARLAAAR